MLVIKTLIHGSIVVDIQRYFIEVYKKNVKITSHKRSILQVNRIECGGIKTQLLGML